jgi:hypothetical protein
MLPGYKFQAAYGVPAHELKINTTTAFFNNEDRGSTTPNFTKTQAAGNTIMLDSWLSAGAAASGQFGVLKTDDNGVANVVNTNGILQNNDPLAGIPLTVQDGFIAGTPQSVTFVGITPTVFDNVSNVGNSFSTTNGSWASLSGSTGPNADTNRVLIAQITTDGCFSFEMNLQIGTPTGGVQNFVAKNATGAEIVIPSLTYTTIPDTASVTITSNATGTVCSGTSVTFTATSVNGGLTPSYQWKKNGVNVGTNSATYTDNSLVGTDQVLVILTSSKGCIAGSPATSNTIITNVTAPIVVTSFAPASGAVGSSVVITGSGFTGATGVLFNGTAATVYTVDTDNQITVTVPVGATTGVVTVQVGSCSGVSTGVFTVITANATINWKVFIQGYYAGSNTMTPVLSFQGVSIDPNEVDTLTVQLRDQFDPTIVVATSQAVLQIDGTASFTVPSSVIGNNLYVAIFHRSAVQTWSATPITFSSTTSYDFTTSASQAFFDNQVEVETGVFAIYSGDINQDENVDIFDAPELDSDIANFFFGYYRTDLNGDGNVDIFDSPILDANISNFIFSAHP